MPLRRYIFETIYISCVHWWQLTLNISDAVHTKDRYICARLSGEGGEVGVGEDRSGGLGHLLDTGAPQGLMVLVFSPLGTCTLGLQPGPLATNTIRPSPYKVTKEESKDFYAV